ncbi:MAG: T9SS type A sorting domain-containing protein [Candidatus Kapabacteria bacterium]|nr:T9SS type A sorting domain-containing protein [Candidatus Kapabacteria bacterium]
MIRLRRLLTIVLAILCSCSGLAIADNPVTITGFGRLVELRESSMIYRVAEQWGVFGALDTVALSNEVAIVGCSREGLQPDVDMTLEFTSDNEQTVRVISISVQSCYPIHTYVGRIASVTGNVIQMSIEAFDSPLPYGDSVSIIMTAGATVSSCDGRPRSIDRLTPGRLIYATGEIRSPKTLTTESIYFGDDCAYTTSGVFIVDSKTDTSLLVTDIIGALTALRLPERDPQSPDPAVIVDDCLGKELRYDDITSGDTIRATVTVIPDEFSSVSQVTVLNNCNDTLRYMSNGVIFNGLYVEHDDASITIKNQFGRIQVVQYAEGMPVVNCTNDISSLSAVKRNDVIQLIARPDDSGVQIARSARLFIECLDVISVNGRITDCAGRPRSSDDVRLVGSFFDGVLVIRDNVPVLFRGSVSIDCPEVVEKTITIVERTTTTLRATIDATNEELTLEKPEYVTILDISGVLLGWDDIQPGDKACATMSVIDDAVVALFLVKNGRCYEPSEEPEPIRMVVEGTITENVNGVLGLQSQANNVRVVTNDMTKAEIPVVTMTPGIKVRITSSNRTSIYQPVADMIELINDATTSVNETTLHEFGISPVPARDVVAVRGDVLRLDLYAIDGRFVAGSNGKQLDLANVQAGTYILRVTSGSGSTKTVLLPVF